MKGLLTYRSVATSHTGLDRRLNEDGFLDRADLGPWVIADGMGGMTAGDVASQAIVAALGGITPQVTGAAYLGEIRDRLARVNAERQGLPARRGAGTAMGSTVAGLLVFADHFACFWAGDSRVCRLREDEPVQLTPDLSMIQEMIDAGVLSPDQAETHPYASVINRAVGVEETLQFELTHARIQPGDIFLLCSDGLTRMVSDRELESDIDGTLLDETCEALLARVLSRGARDNVTFILVSCFPNEALLPPL